MNGVHDMGGMHGFGPIDHEEGGPLFHTPWEGRVRAMMHALVKRDLFTLDEQRRTIESLPPQQYLASTYFERWLAALRLLVEEKGLLTSPEIEATVRRLERGSGSAPARRDDPSLAARVVNEIVHPRRRPVQAVISRFRPGDHVRAKNQHVRGHTRLPRYIRGKQGVVDRVHGIYDFPDTIAHGRGAAPQPVYSVRFAARELWGDAAAPKDSVCIDLWESYLDPA